MATLIYISDTLFEDNSLLGSFSRAILKHSKTQSLLICRASGPENRPEQVLLMSKKIAGELNESGISVVRVEGYNKGLIKLDENGSVTVSRPQWISELLANRVVVSLSMMGQGLEHPQKVTLELFLESITNSGEIDIDRIIIVSKKTPKSNINSEISASELLLDAESWISKTESEAFLKSLGTYKGTDIYLSSTRGLVSNKLDELLKVNT